MRNALTEDSRTTIAPIAAKTAMGALRKSMIQNRAKYVIRSMGVSTRFSRGVGVDEMESSSLLVYIYFEGVAMPYPFSNRFEPC
jgi:hypothetical protein